MEQNSLYKSLRIYRLSCAKRKIICTQPAFWFFPYPEVSPLPVYETRKLLSNVFESQWYEKTFQ